MVVWLVALMVVMLAGTKADVKVAMMDNALVSQEADE